MIPAIAVLHQGFLPRYFFSFGCALLHGQENDRCDLASAYRW
jgi:hypothetical protein